MKKRMILYCALLSLSVLPAAAEVTPENLQQLNMQSMDIEKGLQAFLEQKGAIVSSTVKQLHARIETTNQKIVQIANDLRQKEATCAKVPTPICDKEMKDLVNQIDRLSKSQLADMERLQSLSTQFGQTYDMMVRVLRTMQASRASIIANMR